MPKPDGTLYPWERAELNGAQRRYESAVNQTKMHAKSSAPGIYEAAEKRAYAEWMQTLTKYAGCK